MDGIYINQLDKFKDHMVAIHHNSCGSIGGLLSASPFVLNQGITYGENPINGAIGGAIQDGIKDLAQHYGGPMASGAVGAIADASITHSSTIKTFRGAGESEFSITFKVIPNKFGAPSSYKEIEQILNKYTMPDYAGTQLNSNLYSTSDITVLLAQKGKVDYFDNKLISVQIGSWFKTPPMMYCTRADKTYSNFIGADGRPLYLELSMTFTPYRALLSSDPVWIN